jgi:hypothetical protein
MQCCVAWLLAEDHITKWHFAIGLVPLVGSLSPAVFSKTWFEKGVWFIVI